MKIKSRECILCMQWLCMTWQLNGFKVKHSKPNQLRRRWEVFEHANTQKKIRVPSVRTILWNSSQLAKSGIGIMKDLLRTDPKQIELQHELYDEWKKDRCWFSLDFNKGGVQKHWSDIAISEICKTYQQMAGCRTSVQFTVRLTAHSLWNRGKMLPEICKQPRSRASVRHKSPSWNFHGIRPERREKLDWWSIGRRYGRSVNNATIWNPRQKIHIKRGGHSGRETMNFNFHVERAKHCKKDSRYPPLVTKRWATSSKKCKKNLQKKKEKPEIQVLILKLEKISGVVWEMAFFGKM